MADGIDSQVKCQKNNNKNIYFEPTDQIISQSKSETGNLLKYLLNHINNVSSPYVHSSTYFLCQSILYLIFKFFQVYLVI